MLKGLTATFVRMTSCQLSVQQITTRIICSCVGRAYKNDLMKKDATNIGHDVSWLSPSIKVDETFRTFL